MLEKRIARERIQRYDTNINLAVVRPAFARTGPYLARTQYEQHSDR